MILGLKGKTFGLTVLFTVIEIITLVVWLRLAIGGETLASLAVLSVGLFLEHYVSVFAGKAESKP